MKKRVLLPILAVGILFSFGYTAETTKVNNIYTKNQNNVLRANADSRQYSDNFLCYVDVLNTYYELAIGDSTAPTETFTEFYNSYYDEDSDRNLYKYTLDLAYDNGNFDNVYSALYVDINCNSTYSSSSGSGNGGSSGGDASHILYDSYDYSSTPSSAFARKIYYSVYDYSSIKSGDIVWETETDFFNTGHNALIVNTNKSSELGSYIQTIEAVGGGVQRGFLDDLRMTQYKCKILRVNGRTESKVSDAIYFATKQIGKPYFLNTFRLNTSIDSANWYCSKLVYASWKYAGSDIGVKDGQYLQLGCLPSDIGNSDNTYEISMPYYDFLGLDIVSKSGSTWSIRITNPSSVTLNVNYNSKMCFNGDAENWTGLKDVETVTISAYGSAVVQISENWFATSIVASYTNTKENFRIISYANHLDANSKTLDVYQSVVGF